MTSPIALQGTVHPTRNEYSERSLSSLNGYAAILAGLALALFALSRFVEIGESLGVSGVLLGHVVPGALSVLAAVAIFAGLYTLQPNEAAIVTLFGRYAGTDRAEGLRWANPFYVKRRISLRARNLHSPALKVNDKRGNPVEIGAVIIWRVEDTAKARFEVDDVDLYVKLQSGPRCATWPRCTPTTRPTATMPPRSRCAAASTTSPRRSRPSCRRAFPAPACAWPTRASRTSRTRPRSRR